MPLGKPIGEDRRQLRQLALRPEVEGRLQLVLAELYRDYAETRTWLEQRLDTQGMDWELLLMAGELELTVGNDELGRYWLGHAKTRGAPAEAVAALSAWAWFTRGELAQGEAELQKLANSTDAQAELARAARLVRLGRPDDAAERLDRAVEIGPRHRSFLRRAADLYASIGRGEEAGRLLAQASTAGYP